MDIKILFFASLRERLDKSFIELSNNLDCMTVSEVWQEVTGDHAVPESIKVSVNHEYVALDALVTHGDEVAYFPPVTGG